ncbi:MAG: hypothetical protein H6Q19_421, partial [Bacteroidetes bacterium]|nr:hypothetical protein [Bacteroidota bacterium]
LHGASLTVVESMTEAAKKAIELSKI